MPAIANVGQIYVTAGSLNVSTATGFYVATTTSQRLLFSGNIGNASPYVWNVPATADIKTLLILTNDWSQVTQVTVRGHQSNYNIFNRTGTFGNPVAVEGLGGTDSSYDITFYGLGSVQITCEVIGDQVDQIVFPQNTSGNPFYVTGNIGFSAPQHVIVDSAPSPQHVDVDNWPASQHVTVDSAPSPQHVIVDSGPSPQHVIVDSGTISPIVTQFTIAPIVQGGFTGNSSWQTVGTVTVGSKKLYRAFCDVSTAVSGLSPNVSYNPRLGVLIVGATTGAGIHLFMDYVPGVANSAGYAVFTMARDIFFNPIADMSNYWTTDTQVNVQAFCETGFGNPTMTCKIFYSN